ncbi:MAG: hypothetical protein KAW14_01495 [Candidatus Aegiribacteria sp.]|nr:hypothetical protein [Candidatus Aegiribacteria sp.]
MKMLFSLFIILALLSSACTDNSGESDDNVPEILATCTIVSPGDEISGLAWGAGLLWAVDASSDMLFSINTSTGAVVDSFSISHSGNLRATGLAFSEEHNVLLVGFWDYGTNGLVYQYTSEGLSKGSTRMCGG